MIDLTDSLMDIIKYAPAPVILLMGVVLWRQSDALDILTEKLSEHTLEDSRLYVKGPELDKLEERITERFDRLEDKLDGLVRIKDV